MSFLGQPFQQWEWTDKAEIDSLKGASMTRDSVIAISIHKELSIPEVLTKGDLSTINLYGAFLHNEDLRRANLSGADLTYARFDWTNLSFADLSNANLKFAVGAFTTFDNADLSGANFESANFPGSSFYGANLYGADLSNANLYGAILTDAVMNCLLGCPSESDLPSGYICEADPDCSNRYHIVPE